MISTARLIGKGMTFVSTALMILLCVPIAYEAVSRAYGMPTIWVFETTLYAFIFLGFLGNVLAVRTGAHFRVTLLPDLFPSAKLVFDRIAQVATMAFALLIFAAGLYFTWYQVTNDIVSATLLEVPLWIPTLAIPIGGVGLFLQTLIDAVTGGSDREAHMKPAD